MWHYITLAYVINNNWLPWWHWWKEPTFQCRRHKRHGFDPWVWKIPWSGAWQPTLVFLPGESPWTEEPGGLQSRVSPRVGHDWSDLACIHNNILSYVTFSIYHIAPCCIILCLVCVRTPAISAHKRTGRRRRVGFTYYLLCHIPSPKPFLVPFSCSLSIWKRADEVSAPFTHVRLKCRSHCTAYSDGNSSQALCLDLWVGTLLISESTSIDTLIQNSNEKGQRGTPLGKGLDLLALCTQRASHRWGPSLLCRAVVGVPALVWEPGWAQILQLHLGALLLHASAHLLKEGRTWTDLEAIMLSEVSQRKAAIAWQGSQVGSRKEGSEGADSQKRNRLTDIASNLTLTEGAGERDKLGG